MFQQCHHMTYDHMTLLDYVTLDTVWVRPPCTTYYDNKNVLFLDQRRQPHASDRSSYASGWEGIITVEKYLGLNFFEKSTMMDCAFLNL